MKKVSMGCVFGFLSVALGAFGAHALKGKFSPENLEVFHTATTYMMWHALAILGLELQGKSEFALPRKFFCAGIVFFSGSLYLLVFSQARWWGAVTPIGGVCFLAAWLVLFNKMRITTR